MRTLTSILIVGLLGLSSAAFAAKPVDTSTRDERMAAALKDYRTQGTANMSKPATAPAMKHRHRMHKAKHSAKHHRHAARQGKVHHKHKA